MAILEARVGDSIAKKRKPARRPVSVVSPARLAPPPANASHSSRRRTPAEIAPGAFPAVLGRLGTQARRTEFADARSFDHYRCNDAWQSSFEALRHWPLHSKVETVRVVGVGAHSGSCLIGRWRTAWSASNELGGGSGRGGAPARSRAPGYVSCGKRWRPRPKVRLATGNSIETVDHGGRAWRVADGASGIVSRPSLGSAMARR